jgi:2'-5' RNA ligase
MSQSLSHLMSGRMMFALCWMVVGLAGCESKPGATGSSASTSSSKSPSDLLAIDVLLEPDAKMVQRATAVNAQLRQDYPAGYALDETHAVHISLMQCYIKASDLGTVSAAVSSVLQKQHPLDLSLQATGYFASPWNGNALLLMTVEPTLQLMQLQAAVAEAVEPFSVSGGTAATFVPNADGQPVDSATVDWVGKFLTNASGEKFRPHVTLGVVSEAFAKQLAAQPFAAFTFQPSGVAIFQLGSYGTARRKLWSWKPVAQ